MQRAGLGSVCMQLCAENRVGQWVCDSKSMQTAKLRSVNGSKFIQRADFHSGSVCAGSRRVENYAVRYVNRKELCSRHFISVTCRELSCAVTL